MWNKRCVSPLASKLYESNMEIANKLTSIDQINKVKLIFDSEYGAQPSMMLFGTVAEIIEGGAGDRIAFQCDCGRLGVATSEFLTDEGTHKLVSGKYVLQCTRCGRYAVNWQGPTGTTPAVTNGLSELGILFRQAEQHNYVTLCYFLYNHIGLTQPQYASVNEVCKVIMDCISRNNLEYFLHKRNLGITKISDDLHKRRQYLLQATLMGHVYEARALYDILLSILYIGNCEKFLFSEDGRLMQGAGVQIRFDDPAQDTVKRRAALVKLELHKRKYHKLQRLVKLAFNSQFRNAFAHSNYIFMDDGVHLCNCDRLIPYGKLEESFGAAYFLQHMLFDFINLQRQRFIERGFYEEGGCRIEPIVSEDHGFAVQVQFSSLGKGPGRRIPVRPVQA